MRKGFFVLVCLALCPLLVAQQTLSNDAVIKLVKAGLSDDLIVSTINAQPGTYDTSADGLAALKGAGTSDKVIATIVAKAPSTPPASSVNKAAPYPGATDNAKNYSLDYVHSDRKWKFLVTLMKSSSEKYDDISEDIESGIVETMDHKGFRRTNASEGFCCRFKIELLTVKTALSGPLAHRILTIEVEANLTFEDGNNHPLYKKGYLGKSAENLTMDSTKAVLDLVQAMTSDSLFNDSLNGRISGK